MDLWGDDRGGNENTIKTKTKGDLSDRRGVQGN